MRRLAAVAMVAALALALFAVSASARSDHHFTVLSKRTSAHRTADGIRFTDQLFQASNPANQVGNDRVRCRVTAGHKFRCKAIANFNGEVGGSGSVRVNGNLGHGDQRLNVTGGTGSFAGAAGKVVVHGAFLHFSLVR